MIAFPRPRWRHLAAALLALLARPWRRLCRRIAVLCGLVGWCLCFPLALALSVVWPFLLFLLAGAAVALAAWKCA